MTKPPLRKLRPPSPDKVAQKDDPNDYTGPDPVPDRVLVINLGIFRYGTNDRFQGAAMFLSLLLLIALLVFIGASLFVEVPDDRFDNIFRSLGSVFLIVVGVAIGRGAAANGGS